MIPFAHEINITEIEEEPKVCPRCNKGRLIERKAKKVNPKYNKREFLGCSRFPRCKYTVKEDDFSKADEKTKKEE